MRIAGFAGARCWVIKFNKMSSIKVKVKDALSQGFAMGAIKDTKKGFKINLAKGDHLSGSSLMAVSYIEERKDLFNSEVTVKRSGAGLAIIVDVDTE